MPKTASAVPKNQVKPKPSLEKRTRRRFSADFKLRIITEADACKHGELGALLRRENLYSNQLADWRRELTVHGIQGLDKSKPGPIPAQTPDQQQVTQLKKENDTLLRKLEIANDCLDLQKKALAMIDHFHNGKKT